MKENCRKLRYMLKPEAMSNQPQEIGNVIKLCMKIDNKFFYKIFKRYFEAGGVDVVISIFPKHSVLYIK